MRKDFEPLEKRSLLSAAVGPALAEPLTDAPAAVFAPRAPEADSVGLLAPAGVPWLYARASVDTSGAVGASTGSGLTLSPAAASSIPPPAPTYTASVTGWKVTAATTGTSSLALSWVTPVGVKAATIASYTVRYISGDTTGQTQTISLGATAKSVNLTGLRSFTLYSIDVVATDTAGGTQTTHVNAWTAATSTQQRYVYLFSLPKRKTGFTNLAPRIEVYDINNGHQWVRNIPLPAGIYNVRGIAANVTTNRMYVGYYKTSDLQFQPGGLLCLNLTTGAVIWKKDYPATVVASIDRFALTQDGKKIYMPAGEDGGSNLWVTLDALTGQALGKIEFVTSAHNTVMSLDGRYVFLEGQEKYPQNPAFNHRIGVVDTTTDKIVKLVGPFRDSARPFTINGKGTLVFANVNYFEGFQVGDVATGKVLYTVAPPNISQPKNTGDHVTPAHGITLSPDETQAWIVDAARNVLHVFDISGLPAKAPTFVGTVAIRKQGKNLAGQIDPAAYKDIANPPSWITMSYDGKYVYSEGGEVIDRVSRKVIGQLRAKYVNSSGQLVYDAYSHSRYIIEVDWDGGVPIRATQQFGVGRVR